MDKAEAIRNIQAGVVNSETLEEYHSMNMYEQLLAVFGAYTDEHGDIVCATCGSPNETCQCQTDFCDADFFDEGEVAYEQEVLRRLEVEDEDPSARYCDGCGRSHDLCDCSRMK